MEFFRLWSPVILFLLLNGLVLFSIWLTRKTQVRWSRFIMLLIFDAVILYIVFSGTPLREMSSLVWILVLFLLVMPFALYWGGLALMSVFLLPIEVEYWRQWFRVAARTFINFVRGVNHPYYGYDEETNTIEKRFDGSIVAKRGGPGIILLRPEHAVVLHRGIKLTRVASGDIVFTERLERPLDLVSLRTHILVMLDAKAVTKDGIGVEFPVFCPCQINPQRALPNPERLYPFNPDTVSKVVREQEVAEDDEKLAWYKLVERKAKKAACDVVSTYVLDRLLTGEDDEVSRGEVRARIQDRLTAEMVDTGIKIIGIGIGNFKPTELPVPQAEGEQVQEPGEKTQEEEPPIDVAEAWIGDWRTKWQARALEREARGEAEAIRILGQARARALSELINAVAEGFRVMEANGNARPADAIALSFIDAIEPMLSNQQQVAALPGLIETGSTIQDIRRRLPQSSGD